jgi:GH25 family lysozyme M1 (1,4-beta-N-acetylmuramidase)
LIEGIIDAYHGDIVDLASFKAGGGLGVLLKASQGSHFVDNWFIRRLMQAHSLGLLIGAYTFLDATSPVAQVDNFLRLVFGVPGLKLAIDVEPNSVNGGTVTVEQAAEVASRIQAVTYEWPMVYIGRYGPDGKGTGLPNKILSNCDLWISHYTPHAAPTLPPVTADVGWTRYRLWQYTDKGSVQGAPKIDRNRFNGTEDELRTWWAGSIS